MSEGQHALKLRAVLFEAEPLKRSLLSQKHQIGCVVDDNARHSKKREAAHLQGQLVHPSGEHLAASSLKPHQLASVDLVSRPATFQKNVLADDRDRRARVDKGLVVHIIFLNAHIDQRPGVRVSIAPLSDR